MTIYELLSRLFPAWQPKIDPRRIVLIRPCCIGDVVLATATLYALRRAYPDALITWAVGGWSRQAVEGHPLVSAILDTGPDDMPVRTPWAFWGFVRALRAGHFDLAVSLVRSPLMSAAVGLSGIPLRAGLDSEGRGFGYNLRVPVDPHAARHEAEIYLDVARALDCDTDGCKANVPVGKADAESVRARLAAEGVTGRYLVIHPAGGRNPGMVMDSKRWPPGQFAALADRLADRLDASVVLVGGPDDGTILAAAAAAMALPQTIFAGVLSFGEIAALAAGALIYIGNDTGLTHLAAAAGAKTAMIFGPSDPARYAPFTGSSTALWKPVALRGGVSEGGPSDWDWSRDGIDVDAAEAGVMALLEVDGRGTIDSD